MKMPETDSINVFLLHSHITCLVARGIVASCHLEHAYAWLSRGYVPPPSEELAVVESEEALRQILESPKPKHAYIPHSPDIKWFSRCSVAKDFDDFYYIEEGLLSYRKNHFALLKNHATLAGCFGIYADAFPGFAEKRRILGESLFGMFRYDVAGGGLLILEESRWMKDHAGYLKALKAFLTRYSTEPHERPLLVSLRNLKDSVRKTIDASLEMLDESGIAYLHLPESVVKESFIYGSDMPVYYYSSSLGMYAEKMGKQVTCFKNTAQA